jgi:hypothetical protein
VDGLADDDIVAGGSLPELGSLWKSPFFAKGIAGEREDKVGLSGENGSNGVSFLGGGG